MPSATTHLGTITLTAATSSVVFENISGAYKDLYLVAQTTNSGTSSAGRLRFNGSTTGYSGVWMVANGSAQGTSSESNATGARIMGASLGPSGGKNTVEMHVIGYTSSLQKTVLTRFSDAGSDVQFTATRWASSDVVTSLTIFDVLGQTYSTGSTFSLFGVE